MIHTRKFKLIIVGLKMSIESRMIISMVRIWLKELSKLGSSRVDCLTIHSQASMALEVVRVWQHGTSWPWLKCISHDLAMKTVPTNSLLEFENLRMDLKHIWAMATQETTTTRLILWTLLPSPSTQKKNVLRKWSLNANFDNFKPFQTHQNNHKRAKQHIYFLLSFSKS